MALQKGVSFQGIKHRAPDDSEELRSRGSSRSHSRTPSGSELEDFGLELTLEKDGSEIWDAEPRLEEDKDKKKEDKEDKKDSKRRQSKKKSIFKRAMSVVGKDVDSEDSDEDKIEVEIIRTPFGKKFPVVAMFVESDFFEWLCLSFITFDCLNVGAQADCMSGGCASGKLNYLALSNHIAVAWFVVEWTLRYLCSWHQTIRGVCSVGAMLRMDTFLVWVSGVLVSWVFHPLGIQFKIAGFITVDLLGFARVLRAARLIASTQIIRKYEVLKEMWLLLVGVGAALPTLVPSLGLMLFTIFIFSAFAVTLIGRDADTWSDKAMAVAVEAGTMSEDQTMWPKKFRKLTDTLFTVSRMMNADNSGEVMDSIATQQPWMYAFFLSCTAMTAYCLLNLVTAVICNTAMEITKADAINHANEAIEKRKEQIEQLQELFKELDDDGSGEVSTQEFEEAFEEPRVRDRLMLLGFDEDELKKLFKLLDSDDTGLVDANEFCQGLTKMAGIAQARDLLTAMKTGDKVEKKLRNCIKQLVPSFENLNFVSELEMNTFLDACDAKKKKKACTCKKDRKQMLWKLREYTDRVEGIEQALDKIKGSMRNLKKLRRQVQARQANVQEAGSALLGTMRATKVFKKAIMPKESHEDES